MTERTYMVQLAGSAEYRRGFTSMAEARSWTEQQLLTRPGDSVQWSEHNYTGETFQLASIYNKFGVAMFIGAATVRPEVAA